MVQELSTRDPCQAASSMPLRVCENAVVAVDNARRDRVTAPRAAGLCVPARFRVAHGTGRRPDRVRGQSGGQSDGHWLATRAVAYEWPREWPARSVTFPQVSARLGAL